MSKFNLFAKAILIPVLVGLIVGFIISGFIDYDVLIKPEFAPPAIVFPIVWTILYILMGVSYGILDSNNLVDDKINFIYYLQLFFAFFVLKWRLFALLWIIILVILIAIMIKKFYEKNNLAGILQIPYLLWTIFATYLNLSFYLLNR